MSQSRISGIGRSPARVGETSTARVCTRPRTTGNTPSSTSQRAGARLGRRTQHCRLAEPAGSGGAFEAGNSVENGEAGLDSARSGGSAETNAHAGCGGRARRDGRGWGSVAVFGAGRRRSLAGGCGRCGRWRRVHGAEVVITDERVETRRTR